MNVVVIFRVIEAAE